MTDTTATTATGSTTPHAAAGPAAITPGQLMLRRTAVAGRHTAAVPLAVPEDGRPIPYAGGPGYRVFIRPCDLLPLDGPPDAEMWESIQDACRLAVTHLLSVTHAAQERNDALLERTASLEEQLEKIRDYAINAAREGEICEDGLIRFLADCGLPPCKRQYHAHAVIQLDVHVEADDEEDAEELITIALNAYADDDTAVTIIGRRPGIEVEDLTEQD